ncbi:hypothetical protein HJG54_01690 [Leptolyngbya sp. NK1-12]|uniref:Uncharacterized protein n=1 Tax=Leptolyngbya sp. NK1-12 TaxID=2547451 RepID=A0AA96WS58_9CYAN|nr:hypothetical protein [Leptolyngbya sp. NK1-12]WNZ21702.1 hypothetical protein HJG54_01690 [Leptolyngbya sp. NK1-12]
MPPLIFSSIIQVIPLLALLTPLTLPLTIVDRFASFHSFPALPSSITYGTHW